jgi:YidC/Oxa1 family membrane protein insertase
MSNVENQPEGSIMLAFAPFDGAVQAAADTVSAIAAVAAPLAGGNATALAIVGCTIAVRLLLLPLSLLQIRGEQRRAALAPRLRELQRRHRDDREQLHAEIVALYRSSGASPLAGCLPALLQAPFFLVLYRLATHPPAGSELLTASLFGVPLGHQLVDGLAGAAAPVFAGLFGLLAVVAWATSRRLRRQATAGTPRLVALLPYATLLVAGIAPLAAGLYLLTTTACTAVLYGVTARNGAGP